MPVILRTPAEVEAWDNSASGRCLEAAAAASGRVAPNRRPRRQGRPGRGGDVSGTNRGLYESHRQQGVYLMRRTLVGVTRRPKDVYVVQRLVAALPYLPYNPA
jgi:hypothetical protein